MMGQELALKFLVIFLADHAESQAAFGDQSNFPFTRSRIICLADAEFHPRFPLSKVMEVSRTEIRNGDAGQSGTACSLNGIIQAPGDYDTFSSAKQRDTGSSACVARFGAGTIYSIRNRILPGRRRPPEMISADRDNLPASGGIYPDRNYRPAISRLLADPPSDRRGRLHTHHRRPFFAIELKRVVIARRLNDAIERYRQFPD